MDREKLRRDMLKRLEQQLHETTGVEAAVMRLKAGFSDRTKCPICFYLHGKEAAMRKTVSPIGDMACESCGYEERASTQASLLSSKIYKLPVPSLCVAQLQSLL